MDWVPERGDIVLVAQRRGLGPWQAKRRPALVVSPRSYNSKVGLAILCSISSEPTGYPFEIELPQGLAVQGVILSDRVQTVDWRARDAESVGSAPADVVDAVLGRLGRLVEP